MWSYYGGEGSGQETRLIQILKFCMGKIHHPLLPFRSENLKKMTNWLIYICLEQIYHTTYWNFGTVCYNVKAKKIECAWKCKSEMKKISFQQLFIIYSSQHKHILRTHRGARKGSLPQNMYKHIKHRNCPITTFFPKMSRNHEWTFGIEYGCHQTGVSFWILAHQRRFIQDRVKLCEVDWKLKA